MIEFLFMLFSVLKVGECGGEALPRQLMPN